MRSILLALVLLVAPQDDEFSSDTWGFKISKPDAAWAFHEAPESRGADYEMKVHRTGGKTETSVTIYVNVVEKRLEADAVRVQREEALKKDAKCSHFKRVESKIAGQTAPGLAFDYEGGYSLVQYYLVRDDLVFTLQTAAVEDSRAAFAAILKTFEFIPAKNAADRKFKSLAARCGSEVDWARDWGEAARRAKAEKKLVLVVVEQYSGFKVGELAPAACFMDTDIVDLMRERLVGLRWRHRGNAPFVDPSVYGIGPSMFGGGMLYVTPEGRVVGESFTFSPLYVDYYSRWVLERHAPSPDRRSAAEHLRRGELDAAWELLRKPDSARGFQMQAALFRRLRMGKEALAAIEKARKLDPALELRIDEAVLHLRMGKWEEADRALGDLKTPEAKYWRGASRFMRTGAKSDWEDLAKSHPESRWAWKAAANLTGLGLASGYDRLDWPEEEVLKVARDANPAPVADAAAAERDAVAFLLRTQRADGSWITPHHVSYSPASWLVAITSICGESLVRFRKDEGARKAVDRALDFVLASTVERESSVAFNMAVWARAFGLRFLARCAMEKIGDRAKIVRAMNGFVREMKETQGRAGGWAYVDMSEVGGAKDPSISFVTAVAVLALAEAKSAGADVPDEMLGRAVECVRKFRKSTGSFTYMGNDGAEPEASLRSPLCALSLARGGKGDAAFVRVALDIYLKYRLHVRKERGKVLCHTGPEGTASYYLLYGYSFAAEALAELPRDERTKYRTALLEDVLAARCEDGGFLDDPTTGRTYGAGMALLALERLGR